MLWGRETVQSFSCRCARPTWNDYNKHDLTALPLTEYASQSWGRTPRGGKDTGVKHQESKAAELLFYYVKEQWQRLEQALWLEAKNSKCFRAPVLHKVNHYQAAWLKIRLDRLSV